MNDVSMQEDYFKRVSGETYNCFVEVFIHPMKFEVAAFPTPSIL